jgi:hypothetical protein
MVRLIVLTPARPRLMRLLVILGVALTCTGCVPAPVDGALTSANAWKPGAVGAFACAAGGAKAG